MFGLPKLTSFLTSSPSFYGQEQNASSPETVFANIESDIDNKTQQLQNLVKVCKREEACLIIESVTYRSYQSDIRTAFSRWLSMLREMNNSRMQKDRNRWRMHAAANMEIDLQAWYHALFYQEVFRMRHFWYKDTALPVYRHNYDLGSSEMTPMEEAALATVLCSPDTTYGDVTGQMYILQAILPPKLFQLFQDIAAQGAYIVKYAKTSRPVKRLFRFSFVEGNIFLTWKSKLGNQGFSLREVSAVIGGIHTDVLQETAQAALENQYLSVLCGERSADLFFESESDRDNWKELLKALVKKEQGSIVIEDGNPEAAAEFDRWMLYVSIGKVPTNNITY